MAFYELLGGTITATIAITAYSSHAMQQQSFTLIEKRLVVRECNRRGITVATLFTTPIKLRIKDTFCATDEETDPLIKELFRTIEQVESKNPYIPDPITHHDGRYCHVTLPTNYLGKHTRYYWLTESGNRLPAVFIDGDYPIFADKL